MQRAVITIVLNKEGDILLLKRPDDHKFPNQWCFPGGKIDFLSEHETPSAWRWETPEEAAIRETYEETGFRVRMLTDSRVILADDHFVVYVFIAQPEDYQITKEFPNREHVDYQWFTPIGEDGIENELPEGCGPMTTNALKEVAIPLSAVHKLNEYSKPNKQR